MLMASPQSQVATVYQVLSRQKRENPSLTLSLSLTLALTLSLTL